MMTASGWVGRDQIVMVATESMLKVQLFRYLARGDGAKSRYPHASLAMHTACFIWRSS
jgi:hypothetical protein